MSPPDGATSRPTLYVFAISHYCEKARWALDRLDIDYELRHLAPGQHMEVAKRLGAPGSSVPMLETSTGIIQGSAAIMDWADATVADASRRLTPRAELEAESRAVERRLDEVAGVHVRRFYYSEALVEHPETVLPIFARDLPASEREFIEANWPIVQKLMIGAMDLGADQGLESRALLEGELDWLDGLLSDGRRYLVGDRFSRTDIAAASLLAPIALPKEHPTYGVLEVPPGVRATQELWSERPILSWVHDLYREQRS